MGSDCRRDQRRLSQWWVVCLCAGWCGACRDYRAQFDAVALQFPAARFLWLDVEDASDTVGDLDIETFPTLLIADDTGARFLAPLAPYSDVLARWLTSLRRSQSAVVWWMTIPGLCCGEFSSSMLRKCPVTRQFQGCWPV